MLVYIFNVSLNDLLDELKLVLLFWSFQIILAVLSEQVTETVHKLVFVIDFWNGAAQLVDVLLCISKRASEWKCSQSQVILVFHL